MSIFYIFFDHFIRSSPLPVQPLVSNHTMSLSLRKESVARQLFRIGAFFIRYNLNMMGDKIENIIDGILNKKLTYNTPTSITLAEWYSKQFNVRLKDLYSDSQSLDLHMKIISGSNNDKRYVSYNNVDISFNSKDGRYFDDLKLSEEVKEKEILIDLKIFFESLLYSSDLMYLDKLLYIINELERNIRNHAYGIDDKEKKASYCARLYSLPNDNSYISLNISDYGMGFAGRQNENLSYSRLSTLGIEDNKHYLLDAIEKGISTLTNFEFVTNEGSKNSGYGLYMVNRIASKKSNKLEVLTNGLLYTNEFNESKTKYRGNFPEFDGITSITLTFKLRSAIETIDELQDEMGAFSSKSNFFNN